MSRRLPVLKPKNVLRALEPEASGEKRVRVTLPWHKKDLKRGTLRSVIEQAGYTMDEFAELL